MESYRRIADALAAEIAEGRLAAGSRLPPQREFARGRGIAASTAARVYGELVRRGLAVGEVGRGTFVRAAPRGPEPALSEPGAALVDLTSNFPVLPGQAALVAPTLEAMARLEALAPALQQARAAGTAEARRAAAALLARPGWAPDADHVRFAGNGRQALAAAIGALVEIGGRLAVEELTYPVVKALAARLGVELVPVRMDEDGLDPDALAAAHRAAPLRAVYVQPTLHNPLGTTMPAPRRRALADRLRHLGLPAVEDTVYGFLHPGPPPLAALASERTILVDSLSKRLSPGLTLGFAVAPEPLLERLASSIRSGGWTPPSFALEACRRLIEDGTVAAIEDAKRRDARERQRLVGRRLAGFDVRLDPRSYHCWWSLPPGWRADMFVAAAARRGIAVTPGSAFAAGPGREPSAVRLALSAPPADALARALDQLAALAGSAPEHADVE